MAKEDFALANAVADGCRAEFEASGVLLVLHVLPVLFNADDIVALSDGSVTLTAGQAAWLNGLGPRGDVAARLESSVSTNGFGNAYLLNLDVMQDGWEGWTFAGGKH